MNNDVFSLENFAMERWRKGDPMGFLELGAEDICYVDPGQTKPIIGLDKYRKYMEALVEKIHYDRSEFIEPKVVQVGEAALLSYNYRSSVLSSQGQAVSQTPWNSTEVYFLRDGEWKIVHNHWSYIHHRVPENVEVPLPVPAHQLEYGGLLGELMQLESAAMQRWRNGDPWGFVELYAPDVTYFDTGTPQRLDGREALIAEFKLRQGKIYYDVMEFIDPWLAVAGDLAVLFYRFFSTILNPDGSINQRTPWNSTEVYQRMQGGWRIIHNHWSHILGERY